MIALPDARRFIAMAHLRSGSVRVSVGQRVEEGEQIGDCGNSGNSTQPHLHIQAMDSADLSVAQGIPMSFRAFREWPSDATGSHVRELGMPGEGSVVQPWPIAWTPAGS
jgi:murein DD-endopeptidase MepM/ murein hydrolase activator NlpD